MDADTKRNYHNHLVKFAVNFSIVILILIGFAYFANEVKDSAPIVASVVIAIVIFILCVMAMVLLAFVFMLMFDRMGSKSH